MQVFAKTQLPERIKGDITWFLIPGHLTSQVYYDFLIATIFLHMEQILQWSHTIDYIQSILHLKLEFETQFWSNKSMVPVHKQENNHAVNLAIQIHSILLRIRYKNDWSVKNNIPALPNIHTITNNNYRVFMSLLCFCSLYFFL